MFKEQVPGQEKDLTDFLTDKGFPLTNNLGRGLKGPDPKQCQCLVPNKGPIQVRCLVRETLRPQKESPPSGETRDTTQKVHQDPPKGKESQVSCALCSSNHWQP